MSLNEGTKYYARARHRGNLHGVSDWGLTSEFTTKLGLPDLEATILQTTNITESGAFGGSVSISTDGTVIAIGAYAETSPTGGKSGRVHIYRKVSNAWSHEAILASSNYQANEQFGYSVALSGDGTRLIASAPMKDNLALSRNDAGEAYIFHYTGTTWELEAELKLSDPKVASLFGRSVSITEDGSRVTVTARRKSFTEDFGAIFVYLRTGTSWSLEATLSPAGVVLTDYFGDNSGRISGDGSTIAIGAYGKDSYVGIVYVYRLVNGTWTFESNVEQPVNQNDYFGYTLDLSYDGNVLVVSRPMAAGAAGRGSISIFRRTGSTWALEVTKMRTSGLNGEYFGWSLSISHAGDRIAVGAYGYSGGVTTAGCVCLFSYNGTTWNQDNLLTSSDRAYNDAAGWSADLSGNGGTLVFSAVNKQVSGTNYVGQAYVFS